MAKIIRNYRIEETLAERFDKAAASTGISKTSVITEAIIKFVAKFEEDNQNFYDSDFKKRQ